MNRHCLAVLSGHSSDTLTARYAHGPGPDEALADWTLATSASRRWYHANAPNSTIALTDGTGAIVGAAKPSDA